MSNIESLKPFPKGVSGNPNGRPKGRKNFQTLFYEAIEVLAKQNGKTPDELELEIVQKGIASARKGDYKFYKDLLDRLHGTALNRSDVTSDGESLGVVVLPKRNDTTEDTLETPSETGDSPSEY